MAIERVVTSINRNKALQVLQNFKMPPSKIELACDRLDALVGYIRDIESDLAIKSANMDDAKRPQDQREDFIRMATALDEIADKFDALHKPRERFRRNPESISYLPAVGADEFRHAMGEHLAEIIDPKFISTFGITPFLAPQAAISQRRSKLVKTSLNRKIKRSLTIARALNRKMRPALPVKTKRPSNRWQRRSSDKEIMAEAIYYAGVPISSAVLRNIASGLRSAEKALKERTPRGGARPNPIRDAVLINLFGIWNDFSEPKRRLYFSDANPDLFDFCQQLTELLGVPSFCTPHHMKHALKKFRQRVEGENSSQK